MRYFAFDLSWTVMDIERTPAPTGTGSAEKRTWVSPVVLPMGEMRELTLLQGVSDICC